MSYNYSENASLGQTVTHFQWHPTHVRWVDPEDPQNGENGKWVDLDKIDRFSTTQGHLIISMKLRDETNQTYNPMPFSTNPAVANVKFEIVKPTGHDSSNVKVSLKPNSGQVTVRFPAAGDFDFKLGDRTIKATIPAEAMQFPQVEIAVPPQAHTRQPRRGEPRD